VGVAQGLNLTPELPAVGDILAPAADAEVVYPRIMSTDVTDLTCKI
jgi:hypothetical protein